MLRIALALTGLLWTSPTQAQLEVNADMLPTFNVLCYRVIITNFGDDMEGQIVMGKADDFARYNLFTVGSKTLKVVNNPEEPGLRQEYGKSAAEVNISPVTDPAKRPPVFSWREKSNIGLRVFSYEAKEKVLSVVMMRKAIRAMATTHTNEVLRCRDK